MLVFDNVGLFEYSRDACRITCGFAVSYLLLLALPMESIKIINQVCISFLRLFVNNVKVIKRMVISTFEISILGLKEGGKKNMGISMLSKI